ncbi:nucleotidyltransferase family protein, partial [Salmonella enterica subsp. enterica serovar Typhimurium]
MSVAPVVIVLAAGAGRRFIASGAKIHKLDTLLHHQTVLGHVLTTVKASGLGCYV